MIPPNAPPLASKVRSCPFCKQSESFSTDMGLHGGAVLVCNKCGNPQPGELPGGVSADDSSPQKAAPSSRVFQPPAGPREPADVLSMMVERLAWLDLETARLRGLEVESRMLRKMLGTAKVLPRAVAPEPVQPPPTAQVARVATQDSRPSSSNIGDDYAREMAALKASISAPPPAEG